MHDKNVNRAKVFFFSFYTYYFLKTKQKQARKLSEQFVYEKESQEKNLSLWSTFKHNQKHEGLSFKLLITDSETTTLYV